MHVFRNQIIALASPADIQIALHPRGVCIGDELVCDFDLHKSTFLKQPTVTADQVNAIQTLDAFLDELSGPQNESFWCDLDPIMDDPRWEQIRELSRRVLDAMGWEYSLPDKDGASYVFEDHSETNDENG